MEKEEVKNPSHYTEGFKVESVSCNDVIMFLPFGIANPIKYIWRTGKKGDKEAALKDVSKARFSIEEWSKANFDMREAWRNVFETSFLVADHTIKMISPTHINDLENIRLEAIKAIIRGDYYYALRCLDVIKEELQKK